MRQVATGQGGVLNSDACEFRSVLSRALTILYAFDEYRPRQTLSQLCRSTDLPKTTVHRMVQELVERGALRRTGNHYEIGSRFLELASLTDAARVRQAALSFLHELQSLTRQTVHLAVLDGVDVLYLEKLSADAAAGIPSAVGTRRPAYCTALGKALLASASERQVEDVIRAGLRPYTTHTVTDAGVLLDELAEITISGVAYDCEELRLGTVCAAVAVRLGDGGIGAVSLAGDAGQLDLTWAGGLLTQIRAPLTRALRSGIPMPIRPLKSVAL